MRENRFSLDVHKTEFMQVGSRRKLGTTPSISVSPNGEVINNVQEFKYLGLILDQYLLFDRRIDYVIVKVTTKLGLLYKTRWLSDFETAKILYCSLITPYFDLRNTVYSVAAQSQLN